MPATQVALAFVLAFVFIGAPGAQEIEWNKVDSTLGGLRL